MSTGFRQLVGLDVVHAELDGAEVDLVADDRHLNPHGSVHGGAIATLIDAAMGAAVHREDTGDDAPVTIEMRVTYLEAAPPGRLRASANVRRRGKRIIIAEADVLSEDGTAVAHGIGTFTSI
jgi:uncharacterized protein (TIGR00369 family)